MLSKGTFWTFVREFSPIELRTGRDEVDTYADRGRRSRRPVLERAWLCTPVFMAMWQLTITNLSEVTSIGGTGMASCVAFVISRQSTLMAGTLGTMLRDSPPSEIGARLSWRRRELQQCR